MVAGDTRILMADFEYMYIDELADMNPADYPEIFAFDIENYKVVRVVPEWIRQIDKDIFRKEIKFANFPSISCTKRHRFLTATVTGPGPANRKLDIQNDYVEAEKLTSGIILQSAIEGSSGVLAPMLTKIEDVISHDVGVWDAKVYTISVPQYHNYGIMLDTDTIIFAHCC